MDWNQPAKNGHPALQSFSHWSRCEALTALTSGLPFNNYQLLRQKLLTEEAIRTNWSRKNSKQLQGVVTRKSTTHRRASPSEITQRRHQQPISSHGDSQPGKGTKPEINLNSNASKASNISTYILLAKRDEWTTQTRRLKRWTNQISFWLWLTATYGTVTMFNLSMMIEQLRKPEDSKQVI